MTPRRLDPDVVAVRLRMLRDLLDQLEELRDVAADRLKAEPLTRAAVERFIQAAVDLAVDVNGHLAVAELDVAPTSGRSSFELAANAGAIDAGLAERLAPAAGLRNVLVHRYTEIAVDRVAAAVTVVLDGFAEYVRQVAVFTQDHSP
ncbi:MAG: type VII toxin-antitoxin system HepT family RNase toxin [Acidimicrobiales bacterium]